VYKSTMSVKIECCVQVHNVSGDRVLCTSLQCQWRSNALYKYTSPQCQWRSSAVYKFTMSVEIECCVQVHNVSRDRMLFINQQYKFGLNAVHKSTVSVKMDYFK